MISLNCFWPQRVIIGVAIGRVRGRDVPTVALRSGLSCQWLLIYDKDGNTAF